MDQIEIGELGTLGPEAVLVNSQSQDLQMLNPCLKKTEEAAARSQKVLTTRLGEHPARVHGIDLELGDQRVDAVEFLRIPKSRHEIDPHPRPI